MELTTSDRDALLERFLRYVRIDTQSQEGSDTYPSSAKQKDLLELLVAELRALGVSDAQMDAHGYVMATIPPSASHDGRAVPTIGLLAHVDTYPDTPGGGVKPQVIRDYDGGDIVLPGDPSQVLRVAENPNLERVRGQTVITTDGTTLLGADDKAGIAEIMTVVDWLRRHPEHPHGPVRIAFTPDEEIGQGTKYFDVAAFGAEVAYTLDGSDLGEVEDETFCADSATVVVKGLDVHPGYAKGKLVNAVRVAAELVGRVGGGPVPETTAGREGYLHPHAIQGNVSEATVQLLVRDFDLEGLRRFEDRLRAIAKELEGEFPGASVTVKIEESYRNMKYHIAKRPEAVALAMEAIRRAGLEPRRHSIRGGTDGARLSAAGLPTPNLFAGGQNFHSVREWVSLDWMVKSVEVTLHLLALWAEQEK
jgi:tripeptide aminopeptidase